MWSSFVRSASSDQSDYLEVGENQPSCSHPRDPAHREGPARQHRAVQRIEPDGAAHPALAFLGSANLPHPASRARILPRLELHSGLEEREGDQADDARRGHEDWFRDLEPPEHAETDERHGGGRQVVDRAPGEEEDGPGNGAGGR